MPCCCRVKHDHVCGARPVRTTKWAPNEGLGSFLLSHQLALSPWGGCHTALGLSFICQKRGLDQIILKAPSSSDLLGSILSREPHLWGRGNMNILSAQIQPRHMLARPHPAHLASSGCHTGHALGTPLFPHAHPHPTCQGHRWVDPFLWAEGAWEDRGRELERRGNGRGVGGE